MQLTQVAEFGFDLRSRFTSGVFMDIPAASARLWRARPRAKLMTLSYRRVRVNREFSSMRIAIVGEACALAKRQAGVDD